MGVKDLHTMVRVKELEASMAFYALLGTRPYGGQDDCGKSTTESTFSVYLGSALAAGSMNILLHSVSFLNEDLVEEIL